LRNTAGGAILLLLAVLASGCGDNSGNPAGFAPDGTGDAALLLLDVQPLTADSSQVALYGNIYDPTSANGYRLYLEPGSEGFRPASDYMAAPTHTYSTSVDLYRIRSLTFDPGLTNTFLGRGLRNGIESTAAPLTERAAVFAGHSPIDLARRLDVALLSPPDSAFLDSTTSFLWSPVPGAARYRFWVTGRNGIVFETIFDAAGQEVLRIEEVQAGLGLFHWGVDAIDPSNRVIGITREPNALLVQ
jgi:hypothetical protein